MVLQVENLFDAVKTFASSHQVPKPQCCEVDPKSVVQWWCDGVGVIEN